MHRLLPLLEMLQFEIGHTQNYMRIIFLYILYELCQGPIIFILSSSTTYLPSYQYKL